MSIEDIAGYKKTFQEYDDNGRLKFEGFCTGQKWCKFHRKAKSEFSSWDISFYSGSTTMIGEIKDRQERSNEYDGWFLEMKKYKALLEVRNDVMNKHLNGGDVMICYINFFTDGEMMVWDITRLDLDALEVIEIELQASECGNRENKLKEVIILPSEMAIINTSK